MKDWWGTQHPANFFFNSGKSSILSGFFIPLRLQKNPVNFDGIFF